MDFQTLCARRFSARKYTDEPVSDADLRYIMECVRLAPSAVNRQPWRWLIVRSEEGRERLRRCYDRPWFATAPLYVVALRRTDEQWVRRADAKPHGDIDLAIAIEHLCLAAADRGLGSCWVCNYDPDRLADLFPHPGCEAVAIIPLGHIAPDCPHAEKQRRAVEEIVEVV